MTEQEIIRSLRARGYTVYGKTVEPPTRRQSAPQRQTQVLSMNETSELQPEPIYEEGDLLSGTLAPKNWKALANRRVPWPQDVDPQLALHEMSSFLAYRLLEQEQRAMGRSINSVVKPHEEI